MTVAGPGVRDLDLLVAGEINPDIIASDADPRPVFGQHERIVAGVRLAIGSSSVITACGAARLGLRVAMAGVVGDDALGRFMLEAMAERGLDTSACRVDPTLPTGASVILASPADRAILTARGTVGELRAADVPASLLARARHLHVGSYFLQAPAGPELLALVRAARGAGLTTSLDPNGDASGQWDGGFPAIAAETDVLMPNAAEACHLARLDDPEAAAVALARAAARPVVVVKLGADGALAATADGIVAWAPALAAEPVDTIGAGDSFNAGFLAAWLEGRPLEACLRFGAACGSLSTLGVGGTDAQPTRDQVEAALAGAAS